MVALQMSIGTLNDLLDAERDAGRVPPKPIPSGRVEAVYRPRGLGGCGGARPAPGGPVRARDPGRGRAGAPDRLRLRPVREGDGVVLAAVRARDPAGPGLRLARDGTATPGCVRGPRPVRGARRVGHRDRQCQRRRRGGPRQRIDVRGGPTGPGQRPGWCTRSCSASRWHRPDGPGARPIPGSARSSGPGSGVPGGRGGSDARGDGRAEACHTAAARTGWEIEAVGLGIVATAWLVGLAG